jgi:hypothetical protein
VLHSLVDKKVKLTKLLGGLNKTAQNKLGLIIELLMSE